MADLKDLYDDVRSKIGDIPYPAMLRAARTRVRVFCRETFAWVVPEMNLSISAGTPNLDVFPPAGASIVRVEHVALNNKPLTATSERQLDRKHPGWRVAEGSPQWYFYDMDLKSIRIIPIPAQDIDTITVSYALRLNKNGSSLSDGFFDEYFEVFLAGTLAELKSQKGTTWFDRAGSEQDEMRFQLGMEEAKTRREQNHTKKIRQTAYGGL